MTLSLKETVNSCYVYSLFIEKGDLDLLITFKKWESGRKMVENFSTE